MNRRLPLVFAAVLAGSLAATVAVRAQETTTTPPAATTAPSAAADDDDDAGAAGKPDRLVVMFERLDKNGDGVVEKAEYDVFRVRGFERLDTDKDGRITAAEVEAIAKKRNWDDQRRERMMRRIGITTPQGISKDEYLARKSVFERVDVDANGKVTMTEVETFVEKVKDRKAAKQGKSTD